MNTTATVSGTMATEVRRWCQKWRVPLCADAEMADAAERRAQRVVLGHRMPPMIR